MANYNNGENSIKKKPIWSVCNGHEKEKEETFSHSHNCFFAC